MARPEVTIAPVKTFIPTEYRERYTVHAEVKTASGHRAIDNADEIAELLRGKTLDEVYRIASQELGEAMTVLRAKYEHLNPGQQRMNLGNRIRGSRRVAAEGKVGMPAKAKAAPVKAKAAAKAPAKAPAKKAAAKAPAASKPRAKKADKTEKAA